MISCEGTVTEREYLDRLQAVCWYGVTLDILSNQGGTSPVQVLERIRNYGKTLSPGDELWCVVDKDQWTNEQFEELLRWKAEPSPIYRGIALSNPKFELWLLAHFRDLPATCGPSECERLLAEFLPDGGKHIVPAVFNRETMEAAVAHATTTCPCGSLPFDFTGTNVWELVRRILDSSQV